MGIWTPILLGLGAGVLGTGLGGLITVIIGRPSKKTLSFFLGFAGGIMLAIALGELMPEAIEESGVTMALLGLTIGAVALLLLDIIIPHVHHAGGDDTQGKLLKMGYLLGLGIALHNFPEGVAVGAGYASGEALGLGLAVLLALHNIPEGIAMAAPLSGGGSSGVKIVLATLLAGLPMAFGAGLGVALGSVSPGFLGLSLGFAAGAMLYISFDELLPEAHTMSEGHSGIYGGVLGVIIGYIFIAFI